MNLNLFDRNKEKKSGIKKIRWNKDIPAVVYGNFEKPLNVYVKGDEFAGILRKIKEGRLATTVFDVQHNKKTYKVLVKEIQYHKTTYNIIHLDFLKVDLEKYVTVNIPIELTSVSECAGVKAGGVLRQSIRKMKVGCLLKDMPLFVTLDVADLEMYKDKKLKDISIPPSINLKTKRNEIVASVGKR